MERTILANALEDDGLMPDFNSSYKLVDIHNKIGKYVLIILEYYST